MLKVGDTAPDFIAQSTGGEVSLTSLREGGSLVLYFFPRAFTAG